jgi:hypothetical protein
MSRLISLLLLLSIARCAMSQDCGPDLKASLIKRGAEDQAVRNAYLATPSKETNDAALRTDADNTAYMRRILTECGWPKMSVVGEEAAKAAWLLTQHADMDPQYQVLAAQQMRYAVLAKEADGLRLAELVDRNRLLNNQPQVYGLNSFLNAGVIEFYDIVSPGKLDSRRKEIGLTPFFCWAVRVSKEHNGAPIRWPTGVLFQPDQCPENP